MLLRHGCEVIRLLRDGLMDDQNQKSDIHTHKRVKKGKQRKQNMTTLQKPPWLPFLLIISAFFIVVSVVYWILPDTKRCRKNFVTYVSVLGVLGTLVAVLAFCIGASTHHVETQTRLVASRVQLANDNWIELEKYFLRHPELSRLYRQMYPDNAVLRAIAPTRAELDPSPDVQMAELHAVQMVLQIMENVVTHVLADTRGWKNPVYDEWHETFVSWFQSSLIRRVWETNQHLFGHQLQTFVQRDLCRGP